MVVSVCILNVVNVYYNVLAGGWAVNLAKLCWVLCEQILVDVDCLLELLFWL